MNKKKLIPLLASLTLIGTIAVGATLAYFTDTEEAVNVITLGNVDIDLTEPGFDKEDGTEDNTITDITPGDEIEKDPTITVKETSEEAFVRATMKITGLDEQHKQELLDKIVINEGWILADGYYYYQTKVAPGASVTLFNTVTIPETWGNEMADQTFEIIVSAEAIQADNFNPYNAEGKIVAWSYQDGTPITVENYVTP